MLVNINTYMFIKIGEILPFSSKDTEQKQNPERNTNISQGF